MTGWDMDFGRFMEGLSRAGEATGFVYPTVVTPVTPDGLRGLAREASASLATPEAMASGRTGAVIRSALDLVSTIEGMTEGEMLEHGRIHILAHAMRSIVNMNPRTDAARIEAELRSLGSDLEGVLHPGRGRGRPDLLVVVGPNGSGKSTVTKALSLSEMMGCRFVNPDLIAKDLGFGYSPEGTLEAARTAGRIRRGWMRLGIGFGFETVGTRPDKLAFLREAKGTGYGIRVVFVTTSDPGTNVSRVAARVSRGGHDVPEDRIRGRYGKAMSLLAEYIDAADTAYAVDNSGERPELVFAREDGREHIIEDPDRVRWVGETLSEAYPDAVRDLAVPSPCGDGLRKGHEMR